MGSARLGVAALVALALFRPAATAQEVTLTARAGGLEVLGRLLAVDGDVYHVQTRYGPLAVNADAVDCTVFA